MDPVTTTASGLTLVEPVRQFAIKLFKNDYAKHFIGIELKDCLDTAFSYALNKQISDGEELANNLMRGLTDKQIETLFVEPMMNFGSEKSQQLWKQSIYQLIVDRDIVDESLINIEALATDTAEIIEPTTLQHAARHYKCGLLPMIFLANVSGSRRSTKSEEEKQTSQISNGWMLSHIQGIIVRPEIETFTEWLGSESMLIISGPGGYGKTIVARQLFHSMEADIKWWFQGGIGDSLMAQAEELLKAANCQTGDNPLTEVKRLLSNSHDWIIVLDDVADMNTVNTLIPADYNRGKLILTCRSELEFPPQKVKLMTSANDDTARQIIEINTDSPAIDDTQIKALTRITGANPSLLSAISRYQNITGLDWSTLIEKFQSTPMPIYETAHDPAYRTPLQELVANSIAEANRIDGNSQLASHLIAVAGGNDVAEPLLDVCITIHRANHQLDNLIRQPADAAIRPLKRLGIVHSTDTGTNIHPLYVETIKAGLSQEVIDYLTRLIARSIDVLFSVPNFSDGSVGAYVAILDALERHVQITSIELLRAQIQVALNLAQHGRIASARKLYSVVNHNLSRIDDYEMHLETASLRAGLLLLLGNYNGVADILHRLSSFDETPNPRLLASLHSHMAWYYDNLGDYAKAIESIDSAIKLVPDAPELSAFRLAFDRISPRSLERANAFIAAYEDDDIDIPTRAFFAGQASREFLDMQLFDCGTEFARKAFELDDEHFGRDSMDRARNCNDLGHALLNAGQLDEAEFYIREAIRIYSVEEDDNIYAANPSVHLSRLYFIRSIRSSTVEERDSLRKRAVSILDMWIPRLLEVSPGSADLAVALYSRGQANLSSNPEAALKDLREALKLDRAVFGADNIEVGKDVSELMVALLTTGQSLEACAIARDSLPHRKKWSNESPEVAIFIIASSIRLYHLECFDASFYPSLTELRFEFNALLQDKSIPLQRRKQAMVVADNLDAF